MSASIHLGTQGWAYPDWIGTFYPPRAKQEDYLPFYSGVFDTVELDTTFYAPPRAAVVRSWEKRVPDHFRFAAKLPRAITHDAGLVGVAEDLAVFIKSLDPLGEKRGPLLAQLPAEFTRVDANVAALRTFLAAVPRDVAFTMEFRHASWHVPATWELLREHGVAIAWTEWRELSRVTEVTADFLYLRWLGDRREIAKYDRVQIDRTAEFGAWLEDVTRVTSGVKEVYGYFNNHWAGHSPASANEMKQRLGLATVEPKDRWGQRELWS